jgi:septal ring-binding cell division protein DamX
VPAVSKPATPPSAPKNTAAAPAQKKAEPTKISIAPVKPQPPQGSQKPVAHKAAKPAHDPMKAPVAAKAVADAPKPDAAQKTAEADSSVDAVKKDKTITAEGRRDPFLSPVVSRATGPNCSTGKRCLAIDQIMVRGVVKAESGMIAVVVNSLNKAYFLKENDPVYNGYVLRITGDSVVFKETFQDRLGKEATREVVKKITTPAV